MGGRSNSGATWPGRWLPKVAVRITRNTLIKLLTMHHWYYVLNVLVGIIGLRGPRADFCACYTIHQVLLHVVVSYKVLSPLDYTFLHAPDGLLGHCRPHCPAQDCAC